MRHPLEDLLAIDMLSRRRAGSRKRVWGTVPAIECLEQRALLSTLAAAMGASDTYLYANYDINWPAQDPGISGTPYYIQVDHEVMEVTAGSPANTDPFSPGPVLLAVVRNISGSAAGPVVHAAGAEITFLDFTYAGGPTLAAPLEGTGLTSTLQITNSPSDVANGDTYTVQVDSEQILVQANAGKWYIIGRGVNKTAELPHIAGAPVVFGLGNQMPPPDLHTMIAASGGSGTTFQMNNVLGADPSWTFLVQIGNEKMLIATGTQIGWHVVARGVDGTRTQISTHAAGSQVLFFGPTTAVGQGQAKVDSINLPDTQNNVVQVHYEVDQADLAIPFGITVYRAANSQYSDNLTASSNLIPIGSVQISGNNLNVGSYVVDVTIGGLTSLGIDTVHPYVLAVADPNQQTTEVNPIYNDASFRIWTIGIVSEGFQFGLPFNAPQDWSKAMRNALESIDHYSAYSIAYAWHSSTPFYNAVKAARALDTQIDAAIRSVQAQEAAGDIIDFHFISHSRGAVVISKAVEDLFSHASALGVKHEYVKMTFLDPHPANPRYGVNASYPGFNLTEKLYRVYQRAAKDDPAFAPPGVNEVEDFYQHTPSEAVAGAGTQSY